MPDLVQSILRTQSSEGDLLKMAAELGVSTQQAQINDAIARDQYASQSPFMGLDTASQLLAQLSGGWGTQTMNGTTNQTQTTTQKQPLGQQLVQGALGLGTMAMGFPGVTSALGLGAAGGAGGLGAMATALPSAASIFQAPIPQVQNLYNPWAIPR
jgi:hypothetical protein